MAHPRGAEKTVVRAATGVVPSWNSLVKTVVAMLEAVSMLLVQQLPDEFAREWLLSFWNSRGSIVIGGLKQMFSMSHSGSPTEKMIESKEIPSTSYASGAR